MRVYKCNLMDRETEYGFMPSLKAYIIEDESDGGVKRPAVLVIPGGGYSNVSPREGERIALSYNAAGFNTYILDYAVKPHRHPLPILNAAAALELIRKNSDDWNTDPDKIAVCGFSAGGHLAASVSTMWNDRDLFPNGEKNRLHRPNAVVLAYPVISGGEFAHRGSFDNLTGIDGESELSDALSLEKRVDRTTPPTFLWHTYEDAAVPVENSLLFAWALRKNNVPFEMHIYPEGRHGTSLVSDEKYWKIPMGNREYPWMKQSIEWLYIQFGIMTFKKDN